MFGLLIIVDLLREMEIEFEMIFFNGSDGRVNQLYRVNEVGSEIEGVDGG